MFLKLRKTIVFAAITSVLSVSAAETDADKLQQTAENTSPSSENSMETAIFVRNIGGRDLNNEIDTFDSMLSARLTDKGFAIMSWQDIIQKFKETNDTEENILKYASSFMAVATTTPSNDSITAYAETNKLTEPQNAMTAKTKEGGVTKSSALRIGQMLDAKYMIVATMGKLGHEKRIFDGKDTIYKTANQVEIYSMPLTVRVMDGTTGQSIYGDVYTASTRVYQNDKLSIVKTNIVDELLDSGTAALADNIAKKIEQIRAAAIKSSASVQFTIDCNVPGATAELDGAVIGTPPGTFSAKPGIHQLRLTRQYFEPWEQTINIYAGQKLNVSLEFTTEGQAKYKDLAAFKQAQELEKAVTYAKIDIAKEQSKADADVKEKLSSGGEVFLKNSYIRSDGFAEQLTKIIHGY